MDKNKIKIKSLGRSGGYRILTSWNCPKSVRRGKDFEAWIPKLSPAFTIRRQLEAGIISPKEFVREYARQLRSPAAQNALKPIALLSRRRQIVLLREDTDQSGNEVRVLFQALERCRKHKDFVLNLQA